MITNEIIGWLGSIIFAICALPQVIHTWRTRKADDLSELFLWLWFWGEVFTFYYIIFSDIMHDTYHVPLYFNYFFNIIMVTYLLYAKYSYSTKITTLGHFRNKTRAIGTKFKDIKKRA